MYVSPTPASPHLDTKEAVATAQLALDLQLSTEPVRDNEMLQDTVVAVVAGDGARGRGGKPLCRYWIWKVLIWTLYLPWCVPNTCNILRLPMISLLYILVILIQKGVEDVLSIRPTSGLRSLCQGQRRSRSLGTGRF